MRQLALQGAAQVIDFFLIDEQVAVAGHAELVAALDLDAREQPRHERLDDARQQHEAARLARRLIRQRHDARQ